MGSQGEERGRRERGRERGRGREREIERVAYLEVNALALVRDDEVWVNGALGSASRLCIAFAWQRVSFQPWLHRDVGEDVSAAAALDGESGGLSPYS